ncbi:MAG: hypothetical protein GYA55_09670 [SAR324 cluster bacterium]|uniref:Tetratricopeptide repeat protein n=1 Tax=SAR324 cluster bacterium TaxID=2024889 RepID=A0A7X9IKS5_9DELT|nr:hypothetical protein [SAR324 cluster bacterium]
MKVFREAITYELSMGRIGQPATPLNNSGEVYKEIFREEDAERSWLRATSLPDGCEHVLPSLNLALIYIDELNLPAAKRAMDSFEACVAQYPLRNGEEHKALVALARGRIALHAGNIDESLNYLNDALEKRQWFGKIGSSLEDLEVALFISLGQAYAYKNHHLESTLSDSAFSYINLQKIKFFNWIKSAWYFRQARRILAEDLNDIEDLYIRNTDSLIEYPTFGELLSGYPPSMLTLKIKNLKSLDSREHANIYYNLYLAESYLENRLEDKGLQLLGLIVPKMRIPYDHLMYIHALMLSIRKTSPQNPDYSHIAQKILAISPGALRNYGLKLPVNIQSENVSLPESLMTKSPFFVEKARTLPYLVTLMSLDNGFKLSFKSQDPKVKDKTVTGSTLEEAINKLSDSVFSENME